ncbi:hypothetical protein SO802_017714 [Lithocarpus litseifolius]|uniref:Uncharacterized protein n=1 Tax=Lithocarpus litseifolius TaxID=425828 RepID=A0AAW2CKF2_9ROSI
MGITNWYLGREGLGSSRIYPRRSGTGSPSFSLCLRMTGRPPQVEFRVSSKVKRRPKLKSRYRERVEKAIEYAKTIEDFDDLVDPRTLAFYNLVPNPSAFMLRMLEIEEKKRMTTKFNQGMYARMRAKKNEPLSNLGAKAVKVMDKGTSVIPATPVTSATGVTMTASPSTSVEEIPLPRKRQRSDKVASGSSSIWDEAGVAVARVRETFSDEDMNVFLGLTPNELTGRHLHKLVQVLGESLHHTSEFLTQEARVESAATRVAVLEAENLKLKKDLIASMDEANVVKEKVKVLSDDLRAERQLTLEKDEQLTVANQKIKTIAANAVEAFQQTDEYNTVLFSWYFKGFELLRRYLVKHLAGVHLDSLDLEEVDKEMVADEASHSSAPKGDAPDGAFPPPAVDDVATT